MAAEIYYFNVPHDSNKDRPNPVVIEKGVFCATGYGDGTGYETFVRIHNGHVLIFSGVVAIEPEAQDTDTKQDTVTIDVEKHIATLPVGQPHFEPLIGPENNNQAVLLIKNIGDVNASPIDN